MSDINFRLPLPAARLLHLAEGRGAEKMCG
jgi:hypothetical protein